MGFFDEFQDTGGASYVGKDEKAELIKDGTPLAVKRVYKGPSRFGERYVLITELDGEDRALPFGAGSVESRDFMLDALIEYLEREDAEPVEVKLVQKDRSVLVVDANKADA